MMPPLFPQFVNAVLIAGTSETPALLEEVTVHVARFLSVPAAKMHEKVDTVAKIAKRFRMFLLGIRSCHNS